MGKYFLRLHSVRYGEDNGNYTCQVTSGPYKLHWTFTLRVQMSLYLPPVVGHLPDEYHVEEGGNVTMRCDAISTPHPHWRWFKVANNVTTELPVEGEMLQLYNTSVADSGQYTCQVLNVHGVVSRTTNLVVLRTGENHVPRTRGRSGRR